LNRTGIVVLALAASALVAPRPSRAAAISPHVVAAARGTAQEALLTRNAQRYEMSRALGVDRVYSQFALDFAKYPRDGVAHRNILVVLCDFDGDAFGGAVHHSSQSTPGYYNRLFFSDDPNDGIISLREYYRINSHGRLIVSGRVTSDWLTMPHSYAYYTNGSSGLDFGSYPRSAQKVAEEAMAAAYSSFDQNLSFFDNDGPDGIPSSGDDDGYVDATIVIHPGQGAEVAPVAQEADLLWSHEAGISIYEDCPQPSSPNCLPGTLLGSKRGFLYTMNGEYNYGPGDNANGTYIHEFGHTLGLADLYEFSSCGNPIGTGLGVYSLMSLGNYLPLNPATAQGTRPGNLDPWSRQFLGFEHPTVVTTAGHYTLPPLSQGGGVFKIWKNGQPGTEYFLVENRIHEGSDQFLPAEGLLIYHVDDSMIDNCRDCDNLSCSDPPSPHGRVEVVQADGFDELHDGSRPFEPPLDAFGDANDAFPGALAVRSWTQSTTPDTRDYAGADTGIRMTNILGAQDGADIASFDLTIALAPDILVRSVTVRDGGAGNSNGILDEAETDSLAVTLQNAGTASAGLTLTLNTSDPGITVVSGASTAPAAGAGATVASVAPLRITVGTFPSLPHPVVFTLGWNDGTTSGTETFTLSVGMASGLAADFESGLGTWTSGPVPPAAIDQWHVSPTRTHGGSSSMKVGSSLDPLGAGSNDAKTYADLLDAALTSPMFYLPPGQQKQLAFYSWVDAETNGGTMALDGGRVEISVRGGAWEPLGVDGGYDHQVTFDAGATLRGADVFSGSPQTWRRVVADLSAYSGPVQVRFRFSTNESNQPFDINSGQLARYYEGWYVDDVAVEARVAPGPAARVLSLRGGPNPFRMDHGFASAVSLRFSAPDGLPHPGLTAQIRIFDIRGRLVRTLDAAPDALVPGEFRASWNARTEKGLVASSGIYFAKVDILGQTQSFRLVLLR
jgi:M6 family metalloprotease-like protein